MKISGLIPGLLLIFSTYSYGLTNQFQNNSGDDSWNNPANWSLGVIPDFTHDVTVKDGELLRIPGGTQAMARSVYLEGDDEMIIAINASLDLLEYLYIFSDEASLTNRGNITLLSGCEGIKVSLGGTLLNNDTIYIHKPGIGIWFDRGILTNNELISIDSATQYGIFMYENTLPGQRHLYNNENATIHITNPIGYGIWLSDTLTNSGTISIDHIVRFHPNQPAIGIKIVNQGKLFNSGYISITDSEDYGLQNEYGVFNNESTGVMDIVGFGDTGFLNEYLSDNYGQMYIECASLMDDNRGIYLANGFTNRTGAEIIISGNEVLDVAFELDHTFVNEAGADILIEGYLYRGLLIDDGGFTNHGDIEIREVEDLLGYGIEAISYFHNYGNILFENMGSGILNNSSAFNNYGNLEFHNLLSKAIFSVEEATNHSGATINIYNDDGTRNSWGIVHVDDEPNSDFINDGDITMDSVHIGLALNVGDFINNGLLHINHYRHGIDFGTFTNPAVFTNNGNLKLENHEEPLSYPIIVEGGDIGTYNFLNNAGAILEFENAYKGIWVSSGMKNDGDIEMTNINEKAFYLNNFTSSYEFLNSATGTILIDNAQYGVYLGTGGSSDNLVSFVNDGNMTFMMMDDYGITGDSTAVLFENNGHIKGNVEVDCDYMVVENNFHPGNNIGTILFDHYIASSPTFHIQMKGENGPGNPGGHDIILVNSGFDIDAHLEVTTLDAFDPEVDNEYTILLSTGTITGTFNSISLPDLGPHLALEVMYLNDKVKLKVVPQFKVWTGDVNSSWTEPGNWSNVAVPDEDTFVRIPSGAPNYPFLNLGIMGIGSNIGNFVCKRLRINAGGELTLINVELDVTDIIEVSGLFSFYTSEQNQISVSGDGFIRIMTGGELNLEQF